MTETFEVSIVFRMRARNLQAARERLERITKGLIESRVSVEGFEVEIEREDDDEA